MSAILHIDLLRKTRGAAIGLLSLAGACAAWSAPTLAPVSPPTFGQEVVLRADDGGLPAYLPGTRYARRGNAFDVDFDFIMSAFGPFPPGVGAALLSLGELAPGRYAVRANLHDISGAMATAQVADAAFEVPAPPPGVHSVPRSPEALGPITLVLSSATAIDAASVRVSMAPDLVRVDFDFIPDVPAATAALKGYATYASTELAPLNAGRYRVEAWGRPRGGGATQLYFTSELAVQPRARVVEFYHEGLDHYFMAARAEDIAALDAGTYGAWKRTGQSFAAWARPADAGPGAVPVCRFYSALHNSHFFTADAAECETLKSSAEWRYEQVSFHAMPASGGSCPAGTRPVARAYNNRAAQHDANHRFTADAAQALAMRAGWIDEGVAFCVPA